MLWLFISLVSLLKYYSHYSFASCMQCTVKDARWGCWFPIHNGFIRSTPLSFFPGNTDLVNLCVSIAMTHLAPKNQHKFISLWSACRFFSLLFNLGSNNAFYEAIICREKRTLKNSSFLLLTTQIQFCHVQTDKVWFYRILKIFKWLDDEKRAQIIELFMGTNFEGQITNSNSFKRSR